MTTPDRKINFVKLQVDMMELLLYKHCTQSSFKDQDFYTLWTCVAPYRGIKGDNKGGRLNGTN